MEKRDANHGGGHRGSRNHGGKRSDSSESRGRHGKRKRENSEKRDKDDSRDKKKEKHKGKDEKDVKSQKDDRSHVKEDRGHGKDEKIRKDDKSNREDRPQAKEEKVQKDDRQRGREAPPPSIPEAPEKDRERSPQAGQAAKKAKDWRDEAGDDDERDLSDDEETVERKMLEARKRRQELMKKAADKQPDQAVAPIAENGSPEKDATKTVDAKAAEETPKAADTGGGMFDDSAAAGDEMNKRVKQTAAIGFTGASGEDWDDDEGYYVPKLDELMDERYLVLEVNIGKGVFSGVVKCKDRRTRESAEALVAVKVIRANDRMTKAAELEVALLKKLNAADKDGTSSIIRLHNTFVYRKHFCLVFESMWGDLRSALKTFTKNRGMTLLAVRSYTKQLLSALRHMLKCGIIHCDIKPDNILISKGHNAVKFCDLGTAVELSGVNATPYLGSGYYRSPEIVVGCVWGFPVDTWALASTLTEIFTGKILMPSKTNNQHLKLIMEFKGKIPSKVIKKGIPLVWKNHFTDILDFKFQEESKTAENADGEKEIVTRTITDLAAKRSIKELLMDRVGPEKQQSEKHEDKDYVRRAGQFAELLELMLALDPEKRINPSDALHHAFCQDLPGRRKN